MIDHAESFPFGPPRVIHYIDAPAGLRVWAHGVLFEITDEPPYVGLGHGHGCKTAECYSGEWPAPNHGCTGPRDGRTEHDVVAVVGVALTPVRGTVMQGLLREGGRWTFQYRGDLAYFTERLWMGDDYGATFIA